MRKRRRPYRPPQSRARRNRRVFFIFVLMLMTLGAVTVYGYYRFDRRILPLVLASTDLEFQTDINDIIHTEVNKIIKGKAVSATDFYLQTPEPDGGHLVAVNTVLVNEISNEAAMAISERLSNMPPEPISVPVGMALGFDTLSDFGPDFTFRLRPTGNALVDYRSSFESVGINQVHFKVWLVVDSVVRVINPVQSSTVTVTREVSLVDTVISGSVPDTYLNWQ